MGSIDRGELRRDVDALCAVVSRFRKHSYEALTVVELVEVLEERALAIGQLEALKYELRSPFIRPSGRRTWL